MAKKNGFSSPFLYSLLLLSTPFSQEDSLSSKKGIQLLEEIIVKERKGFSGLETTLQQKDILPRAPKDAGEIFKDMPGFGIVKRGGFAMEPVFRSFRQDQLNIMVDGAMKADNACPNRMDPVTVHVAPDEIEKVEVIKGPYSVRFGPSMGAIINLVTEPARHQKTRGFSSGLSAGYDFNARGKSTRFRTKGIFDKTDYSLTGGFKDFETYSSGSGTRVPAAFRTFDYSAKAGLMPTGNQRIMLTWRQSFARDVMHAGLPMDLKDDNSNMLSVDYKISGKGESAGSLTVKLYGSTVSHVMTNEDRPNFKAVHALASVTSREAGGRAELTLAPFENTLVYAGLNSRYLAKDGFRDRKAYQNTCTGMIMDPPSKFKDLIWQDSRKQSHGLYGEAVSQLNSKFSLLAGIRADLFTSEINEPAPGFQAIHGGNLENQSHIALGLTASLKYALGSHITLQLAGGRGVRDASLLERYINHFSVGRDAYEYVGKPDLLPEVNNQIDFAVSYQGGPLTIQGSIFYAYLEDFITAKVDKTLPRKFLACMPPASAKRFVNISEAEQMGFELRGQLELTKQILLFSDAAYTRAQNITWNEPLAEIPPFTAHAGVRYTRDPGWLELRSRFASKQNRIAESFGETATKGFQVFDLRASISPWKAVTFNLSMLNLLDADYTEHLSRSYKNSPDAGARFYEPGRSLVTSISIGLGR